MITGFRRLGSEQLTSSMHRTVMDASGVQAQKTVLGQANKSSYTFVHDSLTNSRKTKESTGVGRGVFSHLLQRLLP